MRPSDHAEFFRFPAPLGASRESSLRLDADGQWWHEGEPFTNRALSCAFSSWVSRHPDDGRYILTNGYDWVYVTIDDAPFTVLALRLNDGGATLELSDGTHERWNPRTTRVGRNDALYAEVKRSTTGGPYEARFSRHAQLALAPILGATAGGFSVVLGGETIVLGSAAGDQ